MIIKFFLCFLKKLIYKILSYMISKTCFKKRKKVGVAPEVYVELKVRSNPIASPITYR